MTTDADVKSEIRSIAGRKHNVRLAEIEWVMSRLSNDFEVRVRKNEHATLYAVGGERFSVCTHHPGCSQVKTYCVKNFLNAMAQIGLYD